MQRLALQVGDPDDAVRAGRLVLLRPAAATSGASGSTPGADRRQRSGPDRRVRSTTSSSTGRSTATHTQWCDQDTGDTSSAVNATVTTATASSPRRCASRAGQARHGDRQGRAAPTSPLAPAVSPKLRSRKPRTDWFATNRGPVAAATRDGSRNRPCSQKASDALRRGHPPGERHHRERRRGHGGSTEAAGQHQVHDEDPRDELAGRRHTDACTLGHTRSGAARSATTSSISNALTCPRDEVRADRLEPQRQPGDGAGHPDPAGDPAVARQPRDEPDRQEHGGDAQRRHDVQRPGRFERRQRHEQRQRDRRVGVGQTERERQVVHRAARAERLDGLAVDVEIEPSSGEIAPVLHVRDHGGEERAQPGQEEPRGHDRRRTGPPGGCDHGGMLAARHGRSGQTAREPEYRPRRRRAYRPACAENVGAPAYRADMDTPDDGGA